MSEESTDAEDRPRQIGASEYVEPIVNRRTFHCPHCGAYAPQHWSDLKQIQGQHIFETHIQMGTCSNCREPTYWLMPHTVTTTKEITDAPMLYPAGSARAPLPHPDFPADAKKDYVEAREIVDRSPRGAAALLRLSLQKLCADLGESGKNINDDIASLVRKGLAPRVQKALDALRVIGNNAVHPGQMDLDDNREAATALFGLLNYIVEQMITRPNELDAIWDTLPPAAREAVERRDARPSTE